MEFTKKHRKKLLFGGLISLTALTLGVTVISNTEFFPSLFTSGADNQNLYSLTLNSSNKVTSSGDHVQKTALGNNVTFTYASVAGSTSGHVTLSNGGSIVNKEWIRSIASVKAEFTADTSGAKLCFCSSYGGDVWNDDVEMVSGKTYSLGSNPYYLKFTSSGTITVSSILIKYTCQVNPSAHEGETGGDDEYVKVTSQEDIVDGEYLIVNSSRGKALDGSLSSTAVKTTGNYISVTVTDNKIASSSTVDNATFLYNSSNGTLQSTKNEYYIYGGSKALNTSSSVPAYEHTLEYEDDGDVTIDYNGNYLEWNNSASCFRYYGGTQEDVQLFKKVAGGVHYDEPDPYDVGFTVEYNNVLNEDSIFDNDANVVVKAVKSDSSTTVVTNAATIKVVYQSTEKEIDTSKAFGYDSRPGGNDYKLVVEYGDFIPYESNFTVGQNIYVTDVEATFDLGETSLNTANKLEDYLASSYSVSLSLRRGGPISGIKYANFSEYSDYGLSMTLLDPSGVTHALNTVFGTAGTWTIRTATTKNACVDETTFTVAAIPVTNITIPGQDLTVEETKTLQLSATITPNNATDPSITWSSANTNIATVNSTGLVTGVAPGTTTITATATDGSAVFGSATVEVIERVVSGYERVTTSSLENGSYVVFVYKNTGNEYRLMAEQTYYDKTTDPRSRGTVIATLTDGVIETLPEGGYEFMVTKNGDNTYSFYDSVNDAYLSAISSSANLLGLSNTINANSKFSYAYGSSGDTLIAQGSYSRKVMKATYMYMALYDTSNTTAGLVSVYSRVGKKVYPSSITLSGSNSVSVGSTTTIGVNYVGDGVNVKEVTWRSSNTSVATVSNGVVTGVAAGNATIYAKAKTKDGFTAEVAHNITVSNVDVTGVTLDKSSGTIKVGGTVTLVPTVSPSNATNKSVTWSTSDSSVATVVNGVVTAVAAGTATITCTTVDGNKTATYTATVTSSGGGGGGSGATEWTLVTDASTLSVGDVIVIANYTKGAVAGDVSSQIMSSVTSGLTFSDSSTISELPDSAMQLTLGGESGAWTLSNSDGDLLGATAVKKLAWGSGTTTWDISIDSEGATIQNTNSSYGRFLYNNNDPRFTTYSSATSGSMLLPDIYIGGSADPVDPTGISLDPTSLSLSKGQSADITASITPKNANQNKTITWTSSNTSVATVSGGKVTVGSNASTGATATITAKLNDAPGKPQATATVTVTEQSNDAWTILIYMCGSDLESGNGFATGDIAEMLQLRNSQPNDINIVIQTGGTTKWQNYSISATKIGRYILEPGKSTPTRVEQNSQANMGASKTLQEFIEWGVTNYPADKTGLIFWNHGGALDGVCWDDNYGGENGDCLTNDECLTAFKNAFKTLGRTEPLEWVGYDACLMAVQDVAEFNSPYFKYMVASQESEDGEGWDYDNWVDDLYAKKSTEAILTAIVDSFIVEQGTGSNQTLSVLNLQYMSAYKTAWEAMAGALASNYIKSNSAWTTMKGYVNTAQKYGYSSNYLGSENNNGYVYDIFNVSDVLSKFKTNYSNCSSQITSAQNALSNLITYNRCGTKAKTSCGLCCFFPISQYGTSSYYTTSITHFTSWRSLCFDYKN